jgi:hypothetical protein
LTRRRVFYLHSTLAYWAYWPLILDILILQFGFVVVPAFRTPAVPPTATTVAPAPKPAAGARNIAAAVPAPTFFGGSSPAIPVAGIWVIGGNSESD